MKRSDFNDEAFEEMLRTELTEQMADLESQLDGLNHPLLESFHRVIAYNSVPGTYMGGDYD